MSMHPTKIDIAVTEALNAQGELYDAMLSACRSRVKELETRYHAASGLAYSWGNYATREILEEEIDRIVADEA